MKTMTETRPEIKKFIGQHWDHVVVSVSGGKDSSVLMQYAMDNFKKGATLHFVHAVIDIDWHETMDVVKMQARHFQVEVDFVQAVDKNGMPKGFLSKLTSPRMKRSGEITEQSFPDMCNRWCTSELKSAPIDKYCRGLSGRILVLIGERAEESANRAALDMIRPDEDLSKAGRTVVKFSPILEMLETEVWYVINTNGIPKHPCYSLGVSRASCAICIFSSDREIAIAADHAPDIVAAYVSAERKVKHTFRYKAATKKKAAETITVEQILKQQGAWTKIADLLEVKESA
jgi:3'-phosphoadenosine 5'-phosphosulfate sulfotransferase (PAPS reductase)/FAD synthetase